MTSRGVFLLLVAASLIGPQARAQDASVGDKGDIGTADPLNALERKNATPPPPEPPAMPDFKEVPAAPSAEESPPSEDSSAVPAPEIASPEPAPAKSAARPSRKSRKARMQSRSDDESSRAPDSPDVRRESSFNQIYKKYNAQPTPLETWEQASGSRQSEQYKVQKGDTLWDLSKTLFGDPNYWPKIWALNNDEMYNPHEIETWMHVRFFPGSLNEPPTLAIAESPKVAQNGDSDFGLIPPAKPSKPIIRKLPDSVPLYRMSAVNKSPPQLEMVQPHRLQFSSMIPLSYYVTDAAVGGEGEVKETELGQRSASEFQYVFVNVAGGESRIYTAVKDLGELKDSSQVHEAHLVEVQGEVEVIESVGTGLHRAIVRRNLAPIEVGSRLIPGPLTMVSTASGALATGASGRIIGSQFESGRRLADIGGIVFLKGTGLQEGTVVPVFSSVRLRNPDSGARINDRQVGAVRIVKTSGAFATGVLVEITDEIMVGDAVGGSAGIDAGEAIEMSEPAVEASPTEPGTDDLLEEPGSNAVPDSGAAVVPEVTPAPTEGGPELDFDAPAAPESAPAAPANGAGDDELTL